MSEHADSNREVQTERARLVEDILGLEFPEKLVYEAVMQFGSQPEIYRQAFSRLDLGKNERVKAIQKRRETLLSASQADLHRLHTQLKARREAANRAATEAAAKRKQEREAEVERKRFYNTPGLQVDWDRWARSESWTFDEAIALILGRDPEVVTPKAVLKEIEATKMLLGPPTSKFLVDYQRLRGIAERASAMQPRSALRPWDVIDWTIARSGFELPATLLEAVEHCQPRSPANLQPPRHAPTASARSAQNLRRDTLSPAIEEAQKRTGARYDVAAVWAALGVMAEEKFPPLFGCTEDGIQYLRDGQPATLSRDAVAKRLQRAKQRPGG